MIRVPSLSKKGDKIGDMYIKESSILYMRGWKNPTGEDRAVVYLIGGKDVIVDLSIRELAEYIYDIEKVKSVFNEFKDK
tara:strand:- start:544 stop:780 length:237 start_codon:yes stop_codon:yes gene_type:complete